MMRDFRFGARMLVKTPAFTAIAVLALALGIGASIPTFSVVNALLLRPWPYIQDQNRILYVSEYFPKVSSDHDNGVAYPDYLDFKRQAATLEGFGTTTIATMVLSDGDKPDRYLGAFITADAFSVLGVRPILGRTYGVMAYSVRQRTQEIGVRMALGAQTGDVLRLVTGHGIRLIVLGLAIGVVFAFFLTKLLQGNLEGISVHDPLSFAVVSGVLLIVGLVACYLPARTATQLDPVEALRYE